MFSHFMIVKLHSIIKDQNFREPIKQHVIFSQKKKKHVVDGYLC